MARKKRHCVCALCGGDVFLTQERLGLLVRDKLLVLDDVQLGLCDVCGERYHPLPTAERIHARIAAAAKDGQITKRDAKHLTYVHEPQLDRHKDLVEGQFSTRLQALERRIDQLEAALA